MYLYGTGRVNDQGHLEIGGVDTIELTKNYGTPLYVYDIALVRERARGFKKTFEKLGVPAQVAYASKAFSSIAMIQVAEQEGLSLDVVSGGELYTAGIGTVNFLTEQGRPPACELEHALSESFAQLGSLETLSKGPGNSQ